MVTLHTAQTGGFFRKTFSRKLCGSAFLGWVKGQTQTEVSIPSWPISGTEPRSLHYTGSFLPPSQLKSPNLLDTLGYSCFQPVVGPLLYST